MTKIYLTRHGETEWNKQLRFQGQKNSELTEKGLIAAELLSERVEEIDLDYIIASPLKRAYQTAEIVRGKKPVEIIKHDGFKEINLGDFEGYTYKEITQYKGDLLKIIESDPFNNSYPNGESLLQFYKRVEQSFIDIIDKYRGKKTLIVAHGGTIKCIECYIRNKQITKDWMGSVVHNCSLSYVEVDDKNNIKEIFFNDIEHLKGNLALN